MNSSLLSIPNKNNILRRSINNEQNYDNPYSNKSLSIGKHLSNFRKDSPFIVRFYKSSL